MLTPFDWQEGIGRRAQYVEARLAHGAPVVALSIEEGILIVTARRQARKIFEIYDRLAFAAIGQQSDIEAIRVAAVDFAHQEGFNRSEEEVTIQRLVMGLSASVKRAFSDFNTSPITAISLFAEVGATPEQDAFMVLGYDGDYESKTTCAAIAPTAEKTMELESNLRNLKSDKLEKVQKELAALIGEEADQTIESALLSRSVARANRFALLGS